MKELREYKSEPPQQSGRIAVMMQSARTAEARGQSTAAQKQYADLVFLLKGMQQSTTKDGKVETTFAGDNDKKLYKRTWNYVRAHIREPEE